MWCSKATGRSLRPCGGRPHQGDVQNKRVAGQLVGLLCLVAASRQVQGSRLREMDHKGVGREVPDGHGCEEAKGGNGVPNASEYAAGASVCNGYKTVAVSSPHSICAGLPRPYRAPPSDSPWTCPFPRTPGKLDACRVHV